MCCADHHHGHETVTTAQLADDIEDIRFDKSYEERTNAVCDSIKQLRVRGAALINKTRADINRSLDRAELEVEKYFEREI